MPTLTLKLAGTVDAARAQALAAALTELSTTLLGKRREVTAVIVETLPASQWFIDGKAVAQPTAQLAIDITADTNSAEQKTRFVEAAFAELRRQLAPLGSLAAASYVQVRELPATDWGYGGLTQSGRAALRHAAQATAAA